MSYNSRLWVVNRFGCYPSPYAAYLGVGIVLVYGFTKISFAKWVDPIEPLLLVFVASVFFIYSGRLRLSFPVWLLIPAVLVPVITWAHTYFYFPELAASSPRADHLVRHFLFIFMAWWLGGNTRNVLTLWIVGSLGLLFAPWSLGAGWAEIAAALRGERVDFGIQNAQHMGLLFGAVTLGLVIFARRAIAKGKCRSWRIGAWLLSLLCCLFAVFTSQTRAVLIALIVALIAASAVYLLRLFTSPALSKTVANPPCSRVHTSRWVAFISVVTSVVVLLVIFSASSTLDRLGKESFVIAPMLKGDFDSIPSNNIGLRIHSWRAASEWIADKPILGWGPKGGALVTQKTEWLQAYTGGQFGHLHSSYFEILTRYGLAGLAIYLALALWLGFRLFSAWRHGSVPSDMALFLFCFFGYWLIVNAFESYLFYWTGTYLFNMVCSGALTLIWNDQKSGQ